MKALYEIGNLLLIYSWIKNEFIAIFLLGFEMQKICFSLLSDFPIVYLANNAIAQFLL